MRTITVATLLITASLIGAAGCSTAPKTEEQRSELLERADATIAAFKKTDPSLESFFDSSAGYAVFPTVGKGGAFIGGAHGKGVLYEGGSVSGFCALSQASIGLQLGGQAYSEVIFFENEEVLQRFKAETFDFSAQVHAVAAKDQAGKHTKYDEGVAVFTMMKGGLMAEATVAGQKFEYEPR